jgi:hypothetical protein
MTQYADKTCRGGPFGPRRRVRATGSCAARVVAVLAALLLVWGGLHADARGARSGFEVVLCADGGPRTIVLDAAGNPMETSGEEDPCPDHGPCCTLPDRCALSPDVQTGTATKPVTTRASFCPEPAGLRSASRRPPTARGPPKREDA